MDKQLLEQSEKCKRLKEQWKRQWEKEFADWPNFRKPSVKLNFPDRGLNFPDREIK